MAKHLYLDDSYYFITRPTVGREKYFDSDIKKEIILNRLNSAQKKFDFLLHAFAILSSHYHYLIFLKQGRQLPLVEKFIAGGSSYELNKQEGIGRRVWDDYWEEIITDQVGVEKVLGYILGNPLKHQEVNNFRELEKYPFASYQKAIESYGKTEIENLILSVQGLELETRTDFENLLRN